MVSTQNSADTCQSRVVGLLQQFGTLLFSIDHHASELVNVERTPSQPNALLFIYSRSATYLDGQPAYKYEWREKHQTQDCYDKIYKAFHAEVFILWLIYVLTIQ